MNITLKELFPGNNGRLLMLRVMLHLRMPELMKLNAERPLNDELSQKLRDAIEVVKKG